MPETLTSAGWHLNGDSGIDFPAISEVVPDGTTHVLSDASDASYVRIASNGTVGEEGPIADFANASFSEILAADPSDVYDIAATVRYGIDRTGDWSIVFTTTAPIGVGWGGSFVSDEGDLQSETISLRDALVAAELDPDEQMPLYAQALAEPNTNGLELSLGPLLISELTTLTVYEWSLGVTLISEMDGGGEGDDPVTVEGFDWYDGTALANAAVVGYWNGARIKPVEPITEWVDGAQVGHPLS